MKKLVLLLLTLSLFSMGCNKIFNHRYVLYTVTSGQGQSGKVANISYINEDGENEFAVVQPGMSWSWGGDFKEGDWVRVQAECSGKSGTITVSVKSDDGNNEKITEKIDLSKRNIVEASMTLN